MFCDKLIYNSFFYTQYNLSYLVFVPNFKTLGQVVPEKSLTKISIFIALEREIEKEKNAKINLSTFVLFSVIHLVIFIMYTKFKDSSTHRC